MSSQHTASAPVLEVPADTMHATDSGGRLLVSASGTYSRGWIPDPGSASPIPIPTRRIYRGSSGPGSRPDSEAHWQDGRLGYNAIAAVDSELGPPPGVSGSGSSHRQNGFALEPGPQGGFGHYQAKGSRFEPRPGSRAELSF